MTAQIGDIYKYQKKEFTIVALSSAMLFDPKNYGLEPHASFSLDYVDKAWWIK